MDSNWECILEISITESKISAMYILLIYQLIIQANELQKVSKLFFNQYFVQYITEKCYYLFENFIPSFSQIIPLNSSLVNKLMSFS